MERNKNIVALKEVSIGYGGKKTPEKKLSGPLNLSLYTGELVCLLGPNGAGKSTLIRTLSGIQKPLSGQVLIEGADVHHIQPKTKAHLLSVVLTDPIVVGNLSVQRLVALGRHPYTNWLGQLNAEDEEIVDWAMEMTGIDTFVDRQIHTLSDGERQKVLIARALAQNTPLMLLDEPTSHLDIPNRIAIIRLLRKLVVETGKTMLFSTHELDLALQVADCLWLMHEQQVHTGVPEDLVLDGTFESTFHKDDIAFDEQTGAFKVHEIPEKQIMLIGEGPAAFWTKRALEREGYAVDKSEVSVEVREKNKQTVWTVQHFNGSEECFSMAGLLDHLRKLSQMEKRKLKVNGNS